MVTVAIKRLKMFEPPEGYYLAFSGGKDSVVLYDLAVRAGVRFDAHYNATGIDPPELVRFIREQYPDVTAEKPAANFWRMIGKKGVPTRQARWCCLILKESGGSGRLTLTGIRWAESTSRKRRSMVDSCQRLNKRMVHPIIDWGDSDVWGYIREHNIPYCSLYDEGFKRIGCILCPMATPKQRQYHLTRFPKITGMWRRGVQRAYEYRLVHNPNAVKQWDSAEAMFEWWVSGKGSNKETAQMTLFEN